MERIIRRGSTVGRRMVGLVSIFLLVATLLGCWAAQCPAVTVNSVAELEDAVTAANAGGDQTIRIAAGTYLLSGVYLRLTRDGISIVGATGNRDDVILDGGYITTEIFQVVASSVTISDLTLRRAVYHPIHIFPETADVTDSLVSNVRIVDPGQQAIKINPNAARTYTANNGRIENTQIELTDAGRVKVWEINGSCYTGGIDAHQAAGWIVRDSLIDGFWCAEGLSEHGIHFWSNSSGTLVERNRIINCDRGIGFGLGGSGHSGGIIRNNMLYHDSGHAHSDVGISLESAVNAKVYGNTIVHEHAYPNAIEYRFAATVNADIRNNLTNRAIVSRDGGSAEFIGANHTTAQTAWFVDVASGDLHLTDQIEGVVDSGLIVADLTDDFDRESRPIGSAVDIGADEWAATNGATGTIVPVLLLLWE